MPAATCRRGADDVTCAAALTRAAVTFAAVITITATVASAFATLLT
ncbi:MULTISPECIES: hypothetical protein [Streptomyces]|nr:hypothetical protein [Streptomyces sp. NE06-03C]MDX2918342.1 hypothetical protein [Streptomyces sp. NE06-03C]